MATPRHQAEPGASFVSLLDTPITSYDSRGDVAASTFPGISPLVRSIYFSRAFVPTYYVVLFVAAIVASRFYWHGKRSRQKQLRQTKTVEKSNTQTSSSSSSTLIEPGTALAKDGSTTERTPLVTRNGTRSEEVSSSTRLSSRLAAFLMYQPTPIPAITARSNHLPSNDTTIIVAIFLILNIFYLLCNIPLSLTPGFAFMFAERASLCFVVNLPVLYLLGAKNNQPLKLLTGWTYEKLNIYHRRLGEWMILLGILHFTGMLVTWYGMIKPLGYGWAWFMSRLINVLGITALSSFLILWATSIGYVREKAYEFFLASHIVLQTVALAVLFFHHASTRPYVGLALLVWAVDRGISRILLSNRKFIATLEIGADQETILLYCDIPIDRSKRHNIRSGWKPGQHVFLSVPGIKWYHAFQAHPFTIGSPAPFSGVDGQAAQLQLIIRAMDGFSRELLEYAKFHQHTEIILDGPYGDSDLLENVSTADKVCLIAGGSGITLTYPLAWSLWTKDRETPVVSSRTVYHHGKKTNTRVSLHSPQSEEKQAHFWIRQVPEHASWVTSFPVYHTGILRQSDVSHCSNGVNLVSKTFETRQGSEGRPDMSTEIRTWLENGDRSIVGHDQRVCLVVCGPDGLVRDVRNTAAALVREGYNINLHVEKFGW